MRFLLFLSCLLSANALLHAADFKGAAEVLRQAAEASPNPRQKPNDPFDEFRQRLKAFEEQNAKLSPAEAAKQWLQLAEDFNKEAGKTPNGMRRGFNAGRPLTFNEVLNVIPPPAVWGDLEKAIDARTQSESKANQKRELGLRLIAHTLTKNTGKRAEDLRQLDALAKKGTGPGAEYEFNSIFTTLNEAILATMEDSDAVLRSLETELGGSSERSGSLRIPNLVGLVGPEKAEAFFRKALKTSRLLEVEPGTATHKLAMKIALEMVDQMPQPQWGLVNSLEAVDLFEAMDKKFNQSKKENAQTSPDTGFLSVPGRGIPGFPGHEDSQARLYYFLGLIARDRIDNAIKIAGNFDRDNSVYFPPELIKQMERAGLTQQLNTFFATLLKKNPESPFWGEYVRIAAHAGHSDDALNLVRSTAEKKDLSRSRRSELKSLLPGALLANDDVEAGIAELRKNITNQEPASLRGRYSYMVGAYGQPALLIAKLGKLLDRKEWLEEGIANAKKAVEEPSDSENDWNNQDTELADFLSELGRGPEAEEVLIKALGKAVARSQAEQQQSFNYHGYTSSGLPAMVLAKLVKVYHHAGRFEDVISLLDSAEYWGAKDLVALQNLHGFSDVFYSGHGPGETPLTYYAASALAKIGRKKEASTILNYLFERKPGLDRLYELLLELDATNAMARLDQLFTQDPFEERPLIWKAHWLRTHGQPEEAEAVARKAIGIDPSDGEQGPGDRMRAYAELAEIRAARGDLKEAEFFRGAVAAIRESETADQLHAAGLLKRAVKMYQDSLTHFADAYCIQSRLAIQLADLGLHEQAEEHYRRAYELMPESFGRVESHCFGCERAFEGERAQGIAERVFTQFAQKTPNNPQVHYLLGFLREEQERAKEALEHYRTAVRLDADYLNAWNKILLLGTRAILPATYRDSVVFNLIRLDPRHRHTSYSFESVSDLATLWIRVAEVHPDATTTNLYPLAASEKKLEEKAARPDEENQMFEQWSGVRDGAAAPIPAKAVSENGFIRAGADLISNSGEFE